jgi:NDP-4-keto-2,6-dideoxyhexose 3-C-methyltransferase
MNLNSLIPYEKFKSNSEINKNDLINFVRKVKKDNKKIFGIGASTKGNVLLQYCNFTIEDLPYIGDVNPDKFNSFTPGSMIPIIDEDIILKMNPDYLIILPWHFKNFFITNPKFKGISLIFPFPNLEIINL